MTEKPTYEELEKRIQELEQVESVNKKAGEVLQMSKNYLSNIINAIGDPVFVKDDESRFILANDSLCKILGIERENIIGKTLGEALPDNQMKHFLKIDKLVLESGQDNSCEEILTGWDGNILTIVTKKTRYVDEQGRMFIVGTIRDITERKQTEKNLVLSKQKLDLHFLQTPLAVIEWDLESNVQSWNPAAEKIFGYTENEILGKHSSIIIPEKYQNQIDMIWADLLAQRGGTRSTNANITKNGDNIFCEWFNTPIIDKTGNTIAVFSLAQDVTEHKQAEEIKKVLFTISNAVNVTRNLKDLFEIIHNALGSIIDVTNFYIAMVDIKKRTIYFPYHVDTTDYDFFPITNFDTNDSLTGLVVSQRRPILLKKDDLEKLSAQKGVWGPVPLIWMGAPLIVKDEIIGVVTVQSYLDSNLYNEQDLQVLSGISDQMAIAIERKQAEEELNNSEARFRDISESMDEWIWEVDTQGICTFVSERIRSILGYSVEEVLGKTPFDFMPTGEAQRVAGIFSEIIKKKSRIHDLENWNLTKDGRLVCMLTNGIPLLDEDGELIGYRGVDLDITVCKQAEEEVKKRTNELKRLNDHLILLEDSERKNWASELHDSVAQSLAMAISKIKTIKEVDSGSGIETLSNVQKNIEDAIKEIRILIHQLHPQILDDFSIDMVIGYLIETVNGEKQIRINYINNLTEPVDLIETTKMTIYRAINELIYNIVKHSDSFVAEIELSKINNSIHIRVEDKGKGFEFNTYRQKNYCGFGLYSLSERMKNMGGQLIINSSLGKGTKVILIVPVNV